MVRPPSSGVRSTLSMNPPYPIRSLPTQEALVHRRPMSYPRLAIYLIEFELLEQGWYLACLLLELFVDCVQCVLDRYPFQIACSDFEAQRKVQVNLLDRRGSEVLLENFFVV